MQDFEKAGSLRGREMELKSQFWHQSLTMPRIKTLWSC